MSPLKNDTIEIKNNSDLVEAKVSDISDCEETKSLPSGIEIAYPYMITLEENGEVGQILSIDKSVATLRAKDWNKKFYVTKNGYVNFTRDHNLLAIVTILQQMGELELPEQGSFKVSSLIGKVFPVVVKTYGETKFIDWVQTFIDLGVPVPTIEELQGTVRPLSDNAKRVEKIFMKDSDDSPKPIKSIAHPTTEDVEETDPDDLPF